MPLNLTKQVRPLHSYRLMTCVNEGWDRSTGGKVTSKYDSVLKVHLYWSVWYSDLFVLMRVMCTGFCGRDPGQLPTVAPVAPGWGNRLHWYVLINLRFSCQQTRC